MKKSVKFSPEVQERAVRMVLEHQGEHGRGIASTCFAVARPAKSSKRRRAPSRKKLRIVAL